MVTTSEQAELRVVVRLLKWALGVGFAVAFAFGVWVATLQAQVQRVPELEQQIAEGVRAANRLTSRVDSLIIILNDRERRTASPPVNPLVAR